MARLLALILVLALGLATAQAARGQDNTPFGPVPTPAPTVGPAPGNDRSTLYLIGGAVLIGVVGVGYAISRDARRSLTAEDRAALEAEPAGRPEISPEARARARKQRSKAKAARAARKRNR